ncbi:MAG: methyltransferase domain-containing protein, partial [Clostridia bacterium]|nr:methyltransferase domain-containing protein [Clostridia bacterium]
LTDAQVLPVKADAEALPFEKAFFDAIITTDSYHYFGRDPAFLDARLLPFVKPGGYLYYSTCSVFKDENIGAVEKFLKAHNNFCIEKINSALNHVDFNGTNAFLPDITQGNGFYVAKLKRIN